jgi:TrmH family RNA methyltransferase
VDIYNPKVVRAAMGAHFGLDVLGDRSWDEIRGIVDGLTVVLAKPGAGTPYWEIPWQEPTALVIGGEAWGVSKTAEDLAAAHVTIPMRENVESLNVAIATSILLFEGARRRSLSGAGD